MTFQRKRRPLGRLWLVYFVLVLLLAWWPWNVWLVAFGAAYSWYLKRRNRSLLSANLREPHIEIAECLGGGLVFLNRLDALREYGRIARGQHSRNVLSAPLIHPTTPANRSDNRNLIR